MNSILSNDSKLTSLEITNQLKIPTCTNEELKKNIGREGEIKFNITDNCLMIRTSNEWNRIPLKPIKPSAPPPPYPVDEERKTMRIKFDKKNIYAEFIEISEPIIFQQIKFLLEESKRLNKKIIITHSEQLYKYFENMNIKFNILDGNIIIT
jgi:hypothetical protein